MVNVAPDRPLVDTQPVRELAQRAGTAGLEDVEQRQDAGEGLGHASNFSQDSGRIMSSISFSVDDVATTRSFVHGVVLPVDGGA